MAAAWQHNYWFWLAAAFAVAGASAEWGPQWLAVEQNTDEATPGRPIEVIRHPGLPPTHTHTAEVPRTALSAPAFPAAERPGDAFHAPTESALQLPRRTSANALAAPLSDEVRVAEFRQFTGTPQQSVQPIQHHPSDAVASPVRLTGKIELIFDE